MSEKTIIKENSKDDGRCLDLFSGFQQISDWRILQQEKQAFTASQNQRQGKLWYEINLKFLIKPLFYMPKKSGQKSKYLENEKSFKDETKSIFHHF